MTQTSGSTGLTLRPLAVAHLEMAEPISLAGSPRGTVVFVQLLSGTFTGRLSGTVRPGSASDWVTIGAQGAGALDVRFLLESERGALISVQCLGRIDVSTPSPSPLLAMTFDTGDPEHHFLNTLLAVARVSTTGLQLRYDVFEVLPTPDSPAP